MGGTVGASVGYALGIAISPIPIAALILTLVSVRPRLNSLAFTIGWIAGIGGAATVAAVTPLFETGDEPSDARGWLRITVGVVFVIAGTRRWFTRPRPGEEPPVPPLMRAVDRAGTASLVLTGLGLVAFNPKDLLLAAAGGVEIASADLDVGATIVAIAIFTVIAASTAIVPVAYSFTGGDRLVDRLHRSREWLVRNNAVVVAIVLAAVGALFLVEGLLILRD